ncbi:beta/gamma crystallin domain-containing protein [Kitasatospora sp. NPDC091207]|uniref:beta/gamma crystallin domain-containing protein n=1 Tax=Kitasatospora sp. NPDC091207 TaxID=3364083 RepID=UPI00380D852C
MLKRRVAVAAGFAVMALAGTIVPAHATNEINFAECLFVGDYFTIGITADNGLGSKRCFANAGDLWIDQSRVTSFSSGNNAGYFEYEPGDGSLYRHSFGKNESLTKNYGTVTTLHIN